MQEDWNKWNPRDLEKLFSPIRYSPAKDKQAHIDHHVEAAMQETAKARLKVPCKLEIPYGPRDTERLDIYGTDLKEETTIFLWVHGGAWLTGHKDWSGFFIQNVYSWGFKSVIVSYPLCPDVTVREICEAIHNGVEKAMGLFSKAKFVIGGHSAGSQLVANILCGNNQISRKQDILERITGFALFSGLFDIRPIQMTIVNEALGLSQKEAEELSPILNLDKIQPGWLKKKFPLHILFAVGKFDPPEFLRQSKNFSKELTAHGFNSTTFWVSEKDDHYTIVENFSQADSECCKTLKQFIVKATTNDDNSSNIREGNNSWFSRHINGYCSSRSKNSSKL